MAPKSQKKSSRRSHRSTLSLQKTEVLINVYDLLPPGRVSSLLWFVGASLLHTGVVVNGREYAYGGHDRQGITGVYWTKPRTEPPGGTFRCELLQGFALATPEELDAIIRSVSAEFLGPSYNLLTQNCNHFTSHLCSKLTSRSGPFWLNRAASIGVALPCIVPREWIEPPDHTTAEGELLAAGGLEDGDYDGYSSHDDDDATEHSSMLRQSSASQVHLVGWDDQDSSIGYRRNPTMPSASSSADASESEQTSQEGERLGAMRLGKGSGRPRPIRDAAGRALPPSEQVFT